MHTLSAHPLTALIAFPFAAGVSALFLPGRLKAFAKAWMAGAALLVFIASITLFARQPVAAGNFLRADHLSAFVGMAIAFFALLIAVYAGASVTEGATRFAGYLLMTLGAALGVVFANHLVLLAIFWGFLALMLYLMTALEPTAGAARAAKKALIIVGGTDALMLFGIGIIWAAAGTFSLDRIRIELTTPWAYSAYFAIAIAAFAKAGAMPFHSWLPDVAAEAPLPVAAYLPAALDKLLGIYLLARLSLSLFVMNAVTNTVLLVVGAITVLAAVIFALVQHNVRRLLGYHAVSQVGYMVMGIGTGNAFGIVGALFHMLNNALYKSCLFLAGGNVEKQAGTAELSALGGLGRQMPYTFGAFLVAALSISGIPPLNGFVSKLLVYQGLIASGPSASPLRIICLVAAMFGSALTVASFLKLLYAIFMGRQAKGLEHVVEAPPAMVMPALILAVISIVFGIGAFIIPIPLLIAPAAGLLPPPIPGWAGLAALLCLLAAGVGGWFAWRLMRPRRGRTAPVFIGGEDVETFDRITGAEFYNTVKEVPGLGAVYRAEAAGKLDLYEGARRTVARLGALGSALHNGILPTYLVWCLLGMIGMLLFFLVR